MLVNIAGQFISLRKSAFEAFVEGTLKKEDPVFLDLKSMHFLCDWEDELPLELLATKLRTRKGFLRNFTTLHMVVVTACCNCNCHYCHASSSAPQDGPLNMSKETAQRVVDMIFRSPSPSLKIEFQGGEPLVNWRTVQYVIEYAEKLNRRMRRSLDFVLCTNLTLIDEKVLSYLKAHNVKVSTSLDGPRDLHDKHRLSRDGTSTYDAFTAKLSLLRRELGDWACSPLVTVTKDHLQRLPEVIDQYVCLGFDGIFLRALNPYGMASSLWSELGYSVEEFVSAYKDALDYIVRLNLGGQYFVEYYAMLLLTRVLTPFSTGFVDLQSPSGAGISGVVYDFNGDVYPTDEARMLARTGNRQFRLGNVHHDQYLSIFGGERLRDITKHSCVETLPECAWCVYQTFCGADPVRNYVESGDIVGYRPTSHFCRKNKALLDYIMELVCRNDSDTMTVFWSWITNRRLEMVRL